MTPAPSESAGQPTQDEVRPEPASAPLRRVPWSARNDGRPWPAATHVLLLAAGVVLALGTLVTVLNMPDLPYHPARDLELRATYDAYQATGVPLVKENGTGSWYGGLPSADPGLIKAAGDDDPGQLPHRVVDGPPHRVRVALPGPALGDGAPVRAAAADPARHGRPGLRPGPRRARHARPADPDVAGQRHGPARHRVRLGRPRVADARLRPLRPAGVLDVPVARARGLRRDAPSRRPRGAGLDRRPRAARRVRQPAPLAVRRRHRAGRRRRVVGRLARTAAVGRRRRGGGR